MERKFKITVEGRQYNVTVEELTEPNSIPYSEPPVFLPPSAHLAPPSLWALIITQLQRRSSAAWLRLATWFPP